MYMKPAAWDFGNNARGVWVMVNVDPTVEIYIWGGTHAASRKTSTSLPIGKVDTSAQRIGQADRGCAPEKNKIFKLIKISEWGGCMPGWGCGAFPERGGGCVVLFSTYLSVRTEMYVCTTWKRGTC